MLAIRTSEQIKAEIEAKLGFFPPFFGPAVQSPQVLENLWQQTLSGYVNNPLSPIFKEKLSAYLSRFCPVPYCMICHSCSLRSLGMKARDVLELLESPPPTETDIDEHLLVLALTPSGLTVLPETNSAPEESLLYCAIFIALEREQGEYCRSELRRILGAVNYQHLITFIAYVKTCHVWMEAHPEVAYEADKRVQDNFKALLEDEPGLADFFRNYWEKVSHERQSRAEYLAEIGERKRNETALRKLAAEKLRLARAVASASDGIVITDPNQPDNPIIYANPAFSRMTGYQSEEIIGRNCRFLQGSGTDKQVIAQIRRGIAEQREVKVTLLNYRKDGQPFWNELKISPVFSEEGDLIYFVGIHTDITEHKLTESKLIRISKAIESTSDAIGMADMSGRSIYHNQAFINLYGYTVDQLNATGGPAAIYTQPEIAEQVFQAIQNGRSWSGEVEMKTKSGRIVVTLLRADCIVDDSGNRIGLIGVCTDITERKQTEAALRQQALRERLVVEIAQHIRQSLNLEEILSTTVSEVRQFLQTDRVFIYRFEPDWGGVVVVEAVGSNWKPILGSRLRDPTFAETYIDRYRQGRIQATADIYGSGLTQCYVEFLAQFQVRADLVVPILQGENLWGMLVVNHCSEPRQWQPLEIDLLKQLATQVAIAIQQSTLFEQVQTELVERQHAEQKIREQAALLDITTDAILVRDLNNQILFWNKGAERLYGWQAEEAFGKNANELLYKEASPQLQEALKTVTITGEWDGELYKVTRSGKEIIVASRWTLVRDAEGKPKSILSVDTDITQKKQLEAQFLRAQRMESIGTLAGGIAHDLNNVLAPILMSAQLLQMKISDERSQRLLKTVEANAKRGGALVKQVLSFARGVEGKRSIIQVRHLISEIKHIAIETFPKSIEFYMDLAPELWSVSGDATQLHQVIMNLCVNARDAMPDGGTLSISAENLFIDENYARMNLEATVGPYIVITVADTGMGIPPEIVDRIFEPFFTTKEQGKGTGLGLSTVIGIIKSHGGFVDVYSEMGQGTQFKVYLPAVEETQTQLVKDMELPIGNGELLLVVDDEAAICEVTKTSLETYAYRVLTASDGIEAIALYAQHKDEISLVLVDMMMPSMDGPTTIRTLQKINPKVKIIAVSGLDSSDKVSVAMNAGVKAFLSKPYTAQELLKIINSVLNTK